MNKPARILVTGAEGFIGQVLCKDLDHRGFSVVAVGRNSSNSNIFSIGNINGTTNWAPALPNVDAVIHLAAYAHVLGSDQSEKLIREVNVNGPANLAKQAAAVGVKRFVFVSSIKVNGDWTVGKPYAETDSPHPNDIYGTSKLEAEQALWEISSETGIDVVVVRPPLVYGPGVKANFLSLIKTVSRGIWIPLGAIDNKRSFIYVENLSDALILCATHPDAAGETYLVSDEPAISTPDLIRKIAKALGMPCRIFSVSPTIIRLFAKLINKSSQVEKLLQSLEVNSSKIRYKLGWVPPFSMQQGLTVTAEWFKTYCWEKRK